ncbi:MAG: aldo/keto reductase [Bryobacteraceae bacterium]
MKSSSRRNFLAAGAALPAVALANAPLDKRKTTTLPELNAAPSLTYRTIGKTGLKVTSVGFGCMITSDASVIEKAADSGITYFDTARGYQGGNNERMVGAALKNYRKNLVLSSKSHASTKQQALDDLDTSLTELGTDHLDIWYLHAKTRPDEVTPELLEAQQIAKKAGKIRFAGVSTHGGQPELMPALTANPNVDVILTSYNFSMDPQMEKLIANAAAAGKGIVAMKVMAGGFRRMKPADPLYGKLKQDGALFAALKWVLKNPNVHTTIPSMTDMDQLDENLRAMSTGFTKSDEQMLTARLEAIGPFYCRMCGGCTGTCRQGIPVANVLRYLTYADGYGQFSLGREQFRTLPAEIQAVRCGDCGECTVQCRNGVRVVQRLMRAQEWFA